MNRVARLVGCVAAAITAALVLMPGAASAAPKPGLIIGGVTVRSDQVSFTVTASGVGPGARLDQDAIKVTVAGQPLETTTEALNSADGVPPRALIVVLDASTRIKADELNAAKAVALAATTGLPPDVQVGLAVARTGADLVLEPTVNRSAFTSAVSGLSPSGQGYLTDGVLTAAQALSASSFPTASDRRILVVTDGRGIAPAASPSTQLAGVALTGIVIDAVGLGFNANASTAGLNQLPALVGPTGGTAITAADAAGATTDAAAAASAFAPPVAVTVVVPTALAGHTGELDIAVAGTALATSTTVNFAAAPAASTTSAAPSRLPSWAPYAVGGLIFLGVLIMVMVALWPESAKRDRIRQIEHFGPGRTSATTTKAAPEASAGSVIARTALAATASVVRSGQMEARLTTRLERAGMTLRAAEWVLLRVCLTIATAALLFTVGGVWGGLMGIIIGWLVTGLYQTIRIDRRMSQFAEQLPDSLQLMIGSLRSGFSLPQALDSLVRESPQPVGAEFGRALAEHRLGLDVSDALERVAARTQSEDLGWAVMAVRIQREVGGNLAEVLQTTVDTMRERGRLRRHVQSLSAEGRISAWVLIALPIFLGSFMFFYRRSYMLPLVTNPIGITMVIGGGLLFIVGIFWMLRVIKVDA